LNFDLASRSLRALPVHVVEFGGAVILKRGRLEVVVEGEQAVEIVRDLLHYVYEGPFTPETLLERFLPDERQTVGGLVEHLINKRILVPEEELTENTEAPESQLDIFYWHFGERESNVAEVLNSQRFLIVGVNNISQRLVGSLADLGVSSIQIVDYPLLRNWRLFNDRGVLNAQWPDRFSLLPKTNPNEIDPGSFDVLIATSDFGGFNLLREWNEFCVLHDRCFLPVILQDLIGYVGPVVLPRKTACLQCLILRQNAHLRNPVVERAAEFTAFDGQKVVGFHPSMASMLGDIAAFELTKLFGISSTAANIGTQIEVNLLAGTMNSRKVLRLPRCPVCTSLHERTSVAVFKGAFLQRSLSGDRK
jgi:bacteriocin biosynthesis cyclodehydratase domain-containing protein